MNVQNAKALEHIIDQKPKIVYVENVDSCSSVEMMFMKTLINILKICYLGGSLKKPFHVFIKAPSGSGKSYVLKLFCDNNYYTLLSQNEDITANQLRLNIQNYSSNYLMVFDDMMFRDDRQKKSSLTTLSNVSDGCHTFQQEGDEQTIESTCSIILSFNDTQRKSMDRILREKGINTRFFTYDYNIPNELYMEFLKKKIPTIQHMTIPIIDLEAAKKNYVENLPVTVEPYQMDFRSLKHLQNIFDLGKAWKMTDDEIIKILEHRSKRAITLEGLL